MSMAESELQAVAGVTREQLDALLSRHGLGPLIAASPLSGGTVNPMLLVNERLVLRFNRRDPALPKLQWEALIYRRLRDDAALPCPDVLALDTGRDLVPFDVLILSYVPGVRADTVWSQLGSTVQEQLSEQLGQLCAAVHGLEWPLYGELLVALSSAPRAGRWTELVSRKIERAYGRAVTLGALPLRLLDGLVTVLNDGDAIFNTASPPTLIHGDLWLSNVIIRQSEAGWQVAALLDWEWSIVADAAWEFAALWSEPNDLYPQPDAFMSGYRSRRALTSDLRVRQRLYRLLHLFEAAVNLTDRQGAQARGVQFYTTAIEQLLLPR